MNKGFAVLLNSFQLVNRNVNPVTLKKGTGKIPYSSFKVQLYFPIQGLAVVVKKNCPMRGSLSWENIIVPFVTHREFQNPLLVASPLVEDFPVPKFPNDIIGPV